MNHFTSRRTFVVSIFFFAAFGSIAFGDDKKNEEDKDAATAIHFPNTELLNQDDQKVRFYDDLLKGKTVVINGFFTTCTTIGSPLTANLAKVQKGLGDRVGKDVVFISITLDAVTDRPERLKAFSKKFEAEPSWVLLTGSKANVDLVLKKLGLFVANKNDHSPIVLIGNNTTGLWKKSDGLADPGELQKVVESVIDDKKQEKK